MFESYAAPDFADEYFAAVGNIKWPVTPPDEGAERDSVIRQKTAALTGGTMWIDRLALGKWSGVRTEVRQPLAWPRSGVVMDGVEIPGGVIPDAVKMAACEAALRILSGVELESDMERGGGVKQEVVGPISTTYFDNAPAGTRFTVIENLLSGLIDAPLFETSSSATSAGTVKMRLG